jgi:hypothetical protein
MPLTMDVSGAYLFYDHRTSYYCEVVQNRRIVNPYCIPCGQAGSYTQRKEAFMNRNVGFLLLAIWLILTGLSTFAALGGLGPVLAILAIASGIFILMGR